MESYIPHLPLELQTHIRTELPSYARLSKNEYSGINNLRYLCYKDISKKEFITYIQEYQPDHFTIFYEKDDNYYIMDFVKNVDYYRIHLHVLKSNKLNNIILENQLPIDNQTDEIHIDNINDYIISLGYIDYDLVSTYNIINNMRKGCNNIQSVMRYVLDKHLSKKETDNDLEDMLNNINNYVYIKSAYNKLLPDKSSVYSVTFGLKAMTRKALFANGNYYNKASNDLREWLHDIYDEKLKQVDEFINNL